MPQLLQWTGTCLVRGEEAVEAELELRQQTFARVANTPGWMLVALREYRQWIMEHCLREYRQWIMEQWDGCHAERWWKNCPPDTLYKPIGSCRNRKCTYSEPPSYIDLLKAGNVLIA